MDVEGRSSRSSSSAADIRYDLIGFYSETFLAHVPFTLSLSLSLFIVSCWVDAGGGWLQTSLSVCTVCPSDHARRRRLDENTATVAAPIGALSTHCWLYGFIWCYWQDTDSALSTCQRQYRAVANPVANPETAGAIGHAPYTNWHVKYHIEWRRSSRQNSVEHLDLHCGNLYSTISEFYCRPVITVKRRVYRDWIEITCSCWVQ